MKHQLTEFYEPHELNSLVYTILEEYLGKSRIWIRMNPDVRIAEEISPMLEEAIQKLKANVPVQYILGKAYFWELDFFVNEHVLIPRQETEELIGWIREDYAPLIQSKSLGIIDIGTGSGCLAIALKKILPASSVLALDISEKALETAGVNARHHQVDIEFRLSDILNPALWKEFGQFDIIVSNPPYVLPSDKILMKANVLDHEPARALFVDDDKPLIFYEAIASFSRQHLLPEGSIYLEINDQMGPQICKLFHDSGYAQTILRKDIHDKNRFICVRRIV